MSGVILIVFIIIGKVIYHINHTGHVNRAKEFVEKYERVLDRDLVLYNVNHIIKDESGELKFVFNSDVFREVYPDKLKIETDENREEIDIMHSLRLRSTNLKNLKIKELSNISTDRIKNDSTITISVTKDFINQHLI
ncbi:MAG: hypothetical protein ACTH1R_12585 [Staphylococcus equorum]|uniref:hypothetical protein n=1 Tax=Staphylococcus TaxID=1279 RepID=UPI00189E6162|nr:MULTISPECIES: hypothetical protein [Staphylococcus]MBF7018250.1 hypothetical protein [Staphylococcus durrellii]MDK9847446.1 hypothetical protein [Staphylococcus equorum]